MEEAVNWRKKQFMVQLNPMQVVNKKKTNSKSSHTSSTQQNCYRCGKANHSQPTANTRPPSATIARLRTFRGCLQKRQKGAKPIN